ncbi:MAG TPA: sigma-54-dependent Fis family transcriptional regulator, partial [Desulfobacteraceae bacterium]|nr:sigma-54-dependent Fis family transcriptional regulator [Desulfobacteraceae bacterium]
MRKQEYEFFKEATIRICGSLDMEKALWNFLTYAGDFIPLDQITLNLFERDLGSIRVVAGATRDGGEKLNVIFPLTPESRSELAGDRLSRIRIVNRPEKDRVTREIIRRVTGNPDSSLLIMRLEIEDKRLGTIVLRCDGKDRYTEGHSRLLLLLNEPFSVALSNFLRHEEVSKLKDILADDNRFLHRELRSLSGEVIIGQDFGLRPVME